VIENLLLPLPLHVLQVFVLQVFVLQVFVLGFLSFEHNKSIMRRLSNRAEEPSAVEDKVKAEDEINAAYEDADNVIA